MLLMQGQYWYDDISCYQLLVDFMQSFGRERVRSRRLALQHADMLVPFVVSVLKPLVGLIP